MIRQLSFDELLSDPLFKSWIKKPPKLPLSRLRDYHPWRVYVKFENKGWAKKDFLTYVQAYNFLVRIRHLKGSRVLEDACIHSKSWEFKPPTVKLKDGRRTYMAMPPGHDWCGYCRRPTVFNYYSTHHQWPEWMKNLPWKCCSICGLTEMSIKRYRSLLRSRLR